jgi:hypothetical protein
MFAVLMQVASHILAQQWCKICSKDCNYKATTVTGLAITKVYLRVHGYTGSSGTTIDILSKRYLLNTWSDLCADFFCIQTEMFIDKVRNVKNISPGMIVQRPC